jgi:hypothetical protein
VANTAPSPTTVRRAYNEELGPGQRSALLSWLAFTVTFTGLRALTYSIRAGKGPFRNISVGGEHLHHYLWGIGLLSGVGAVAVRGEERQRLICCIPSTCRARLTAMVSSSDSNPEDEYADDEYADHDAEDREQPSVPSEIPDDEPEDDVLEQRQEVPYRDDDR